MSAVVRDTGPAVDVPGMPAGAGRSADAPAGGGPAAAAGSSANGNAPSAPPALTAKDFASDQEVRWCPGCGDYAILKTIQQLMPELGVPRERTVFVSGIGCAARFPYYMDTYGMHTIHGRAPAFATGVKLANPDLDVWLVTGDGDGLSIGGNHLLHLLRRNVDMQVLLFNNEAYGLTKGQYSPTSREGTRTPSTPEGSVDHPVSPLAFALGAGARFVGRGIDTVRSRLGEVVRRAHRHRGASFVEILQNCPVYNDGAFAAFTARDRAPVAQIEVRHGEPLRFGRDGEMGLGLDPRRLRLEVVEPGRGGATDEDVCIHDETNRTLAQLLAALDAPEFPVATGVLYCDPAPEYVEAVRAQREHVRESRRSSGAADLDALLRSGRTWRV